MRTADIRLHRNANGFETLSIDGVVCAAGAPLRAESVLRVMFSKCNGRAFSVMPTSEPPAPKPASPGNPFSPPSGRTTVLLLKGKPGILVTALARLARWQVRPR